MFLFDKQMFASFLEDEMKTSHSVVLAQDLLCKFLLTIEEQERISYGLYNSVLTSIDGKPEDASSEANFRIILARCWKPAMSPNSFIGKLEKVVAAQQLDPIVGNNKFLNLFPAIKNEKIDAEEVPTPLKLEVEDTPALHAIQLTCRTTATGGDYKKNCFFSREIFGNLDMLPKQVVNNLLSREDKGEPFFGVPISFSSKHELGSILVTKKGEEFITQILDLLTFEPQHPEAH